MCVTQGLNSFGEIVAHAQCSVDEKKNIYIYIFRVYHIRIIAKKNGSDDMKQTDSSIIIVRNVCVLTSASMIVYLFFTRSWSAIIGPKLSFTRSRQTCTRICRFLVVGNIFRLETCMNSLVKIPPYSKLNFQGKFSASKTDVILF